MVRPDTTETTDESASTDAHNLKVKEKNMTRRMER